MDFIRRYDIPRVHGVNYAGHPNVIKFLATVAADVRSRDELPPILAGLQWIWTHPTLTAEIFALLDDELLQQINARVAAAGREVFAAKKAGAPVAALELKADTYVLETDVHFPTGLNLLWDAGREPCRHGHAEA